LGGAFTKFMIRYISAFEILRIDNSEDFCSVNLNHFMFRMCNSIGGIPLPSPPIARGC
jgi:hypothetical protein